MLSIKKIVVKFTEDVKKSLLEKHNITLNLSEPVVEYLANKGYDTKMGARPLAGKIDELIRVHLSKKILFEKINNASIMALLENDTIIFNVSQKASAVIGEDGIIQVEG
jgi:ATP-dependent Clp protease ATP-binding subunit ClpA